MPQGATSHTSPPDRLLLLHGGGGREELCLLGQEDEAYCRRFTHAEAYAGRRQARFLLKIGMACLIGDIPFSLFHEQEGPHRGRPFLSCEREQGVFCSCSYAPSPFVLLGRFEEHTAADAMLGIDAEHLGNCLPLSHRIFSQSELAEIRSLPAPLIDEEALRRWTIKEACLKALGTGLGGDLLQIDTCGCRGNGLISVQGARLACQSFVMDGCAVALAVHESRERALMNLERICL